MPPLAYLFHQPSYLLPFVQNFQPLRSQGCSFALSSPMFTCPYGYPYKFVVHDKQTIAPMAQNLPRASPPLQYNLPLMAHMASHGNHIRLLRHKSASNGTYSPLMADTRLPWQIYPFWHTFALKWHKTNKSSIAMIMPKHESKVVCTSKIFATTMERIKFLQWHLQILPQQWHIFRDTIDNNRTKNTLYWHIYNIAQQWQK